MPLMLDGPETAVYTGRVQETGRRVAGGKPSMCRCCCRPVVTPPNDAVQSKVFFPESMLPSPSLLCPHHPSSPRAPSAPQAKTLLRAGVLAPLDLPLGSQMGPSLPETPRFPTPPTQRTRRVLPPGPDSFGSFIAKALGRVRVHPPPLWPSFPTIIVADTCSV